MISNQIAHYFSRSLIIVQIINLLHTCAVIRLISINAFINTTHDATVLCSLITTYWISLQFQISVIIIPLHSIISTSAVKKMKLIEKRQSWNSVETIEKPRFNEI